jgi:hypothetical protein
VTDRIRQSLEWILLQLIEAERLRRHRCRALRAHRDPHQPAQRLSSRRLSTPAGDIELVIPQLRSPRSHRGGRLTASPRRGNHRR